MAVGIQVGDDAARRPIGGGQSGAVRDIGEGSVTVVAMELIATDVGNVEIRKAIVVEVGRVSAMQI